MRTITIEQQGWNEFIVRDGDKSSGFLTWDELVGQIASMTHHALKEPWFQMLTEQERAEMKARRVAPIAASPTE